MRLRLSGPLALLAAMMLVPAAAGPATADTVVGDTVVADKADPVDVDSRTVPGATAQDVARAEKTDPDGEDLVAELSGAGTGDYSLVGVTWARGAEESAIEVRIRLRVQGRWSTWQDLEVEADKGEGGRSGTEPLWVGKADGIGVRVINPNGAKPASLKVSTIDPGTAPVSTGQSANAFFPTSSGSATVQTATSRPSFTAKPSIITRSRWGASAGTACGSPTAGETTKGIVVHHTAGTNSYSKSQSASIVRATQAYHVKSRDWCDIGYNFLVDKYGQIFEGRKGGMDRAVRGAHAGNFDVNTYTMGASMMGNFDKVKPSSALKASMVRLVGWRIGTFYMSAKGSYAVGGKSLPRISGHRNVVSTACPGKHGYAWLGAKGGLRDRVAAYVSKYSSAAKNYYKKRGSAVTGPIFVGEYPTAGGRKVRLKNLDILSYPGIAVRAVASIERTEYNRVDAETGELGFPKTEQAGTSVPTVYVQRFQGGAIYRSTDETGTTKAFASWGPIAAKYVENGEAAGPLGAPKGSIYTTAAGEKRTNFKNGWITYTPTDGAQVHLNG